MKIMFAGGPGGHFYPLIAVAEEINKKIIEKHIINAELFFLSTEPIDIDLLRQNNIKFKKIIAGKVRTYSSIKNVIDIIKTPFAIIQTLFYLFKIYPDVVFSKGGYGAFPVIFCARLLFIPVIIHESDTVPGRVNLISGHFAKKIAVSYPESAKFFPLEKVAHTGQPIRNSIRDGKGVPPAGVTFMDNIPLIFIIGGSQGSKVINETILGSLTDLLQRYQIVHQTGKANIKEVMMMSDYLLKDDPHKQNYHPIDFISGENQTFLGKKASIVISRAGSAIFEIAQWEVPSIIIPIQTSNGDHQRKNAFSYARKGACSVIEEQNLTSNILKSEIQRILTNKEVYDKMKESARNFQRPDAGAVIAEELINIALRHKS